MRLGMLFLLMLFTLVTVVSAQNAPQGTGELTLTPIGTYPQGDIADLFDEGNAEIVAYHAPSFRLFVVNANTATIDILDITDPTMPILVTAVSFDEYGDGINSVAVYDDLVAVAVEGDDVNVRGSVVFISINGDFLHMVEVGFLPDMVVFSPDGQYVLTANEGEPNDDYSIDPEGSVSIIYIGDNAQLATVAEATFTDFNVGGARANELPAGVRIYGPNATVAQDLEPEYIAISADSTTAYVTLQENNAVAVIDIQTATVTAILALGYKDFSLAGNGLDAGKDDGMINIANWNIRGLYLPDAIAYYRTDMGSYLVTANEGDSRDYDGYSEEAEINDLNLDPEIFPNAEELLADSAIGGLEVTNALGDEDGDGDYEAVYIGGARSFSIWDATTGELVFDSGDQFEQIIAALYPADFNTNNDENEFDSRSDNAGPEPEAVTLGVIGDKTYAFIGLERIGGVMVYDITNPMSPVFVTYANNRDFAGDPEAGTAKDLGPEGVLFIPADQSPNGENLLVVANEISGTTTVYRITRNM
ncbi:MAG: alkaline phosphatase [Phototrophicales bacterium]|jgi:DNA-binding beta-propeller fold protein YncE|nr:MAG: alkaline phosphatase [Phototrophicales bacterium]